MKTNKIVLVYIFAEIFFFSCGTNNENKLPTVNENKIEIAELDPDLLTPMDVKLSQLSEKLRVVLLETNPNCVLTDGVSFTIGDKYIIARDEDGLYQFSVDGIFIRKIVTYGRAPGETPLFPYLSLVEEEDLLLVMTGGNMGDDIYHYRLSTGEFLGKKGKVIIDPVETLAQCRYIGNSQIMLTYYSQVSLRQNPNPDTEEIGCGVKIQNLDGKVVWQKAFDYKSWFILYPYMQILQGSTIFMLSTNDPKEFILQVNDQDTVYRLNINDYSLRPILLKRSEKLIIDGFPVNKLTPNSNDEVEEFANVNGYQFINYRFIENMDNGTKGYRYYIIYDYNKNEAYRIGTFENDYFGFFHETEGDVKARHNFPSLTDPSRNLVVVYDAYTFLRLANEALENTELDKTIEDRLIKLCDTVEDTDNPIMIIGNLKKNIKF